MKSIPFLLMALLITALLVPACAPKEAHCTSEEIFCIGLVTDGGKIDDMSLNQAAWDAVKQAEQDLGARIQSIESADGADYAPHVATLAQDGYDVIVTVGPAMGEATAAAAADYPEIDFIGVDQFQGDVVEGVAGLTFSEDHAGFLVGALASMMSRSNQIGVVCGADVRSTAWRYVEGYKAGASYADQFKGIATHVSAIYPRSGSLGTVLPGPESGAETARSMIADGADVIFSCGGSAGDSAIVTAAGAGIYTIGVETDQYLSLPAAAPRMLSSGTKLVTPGVYNLIRLARAEQFPSGNYRGDVSYAPFHDLDREVPLAVKRLMEQIDAGLQDGSIKTNVPLALD